MTENEIWKDVVGYEGFYKVSNKGNVFSVDRIVRGKKWGGRTLKPIYHRDGYLQVGLHKNGIKKTKLIHRLVLEAFVENPNNLPDVNHRDEVKTNNELSNLEWCDARYNINYGTRTERVSKKIRAVNIKTGEVIRFKSAVEAKREGYVNGSVSKACRGIYDDGNGKLIGGDGRTYKGHRWYYEDGEGDGE